MNLKRTALVAVALCAQAVLGTGLASEARFQDLGEGAVLDNNSGLIWTKSDNGSNINWKDAIAYCQTLPLKGSGWQLPTIDQLHSLYDASVVKRMDDCKCRVSRVFSLSSYWFWSREPGESPTEAWNIALSNAYRGTVDISEDRQERALCVREQ